MWPLLGKEARYSKIFSATKGYNYQKCVVYSRVNREGCIYITYHNEK